MLHSPSHANTAAKIFISIHCRWCRKKNLDYKQSYDRFSEIGVLKLNHILSCIIILEQLITSIATFTQYKYVNITDQNEPKHIYYFLMGLKNRKLREKLIISHIILVFIGKLC